MSVMRNPPSPHLLPIAVVIAGVTIVIVGVGQAVALAPREFLSDWSPSPQWVERMDSNFDYPQLIAHRHWGRGWRRGDRWGDGPPRDRFYNIDTVETVRGTIVSTGTFGAFSGMSPGMHVVLDTGTESLPVHLGPRWFLDEQRLELSAGEEIGITGSRVNFDGQPTLIASEVLQGVDAIELRDRDGIPVWSHWRQQDGYWGPHCR